MPESTSKPPADAVFRRSGRCASPRRTLSTAETRLTAVQSGHCGPVSSDVRHSGTHLHGFRINGFLASVLREQIDILVLVASGDYLLQPQHLKVQGEVAKEVGASWIVAITKNFLALEVMPIMFQLQFNVFQSSVELVLLRGLCLVQVLVRHLQILNARLLHIAQRP